MHRVQINALLVDASNPEVVNVTFDRYLRLGSSPLDHSPPAVQGRRNLLSVDK